MSECVFLIVPVMTAEALLVSIRCNYKQQSAVQQQLLEDIAAGKDMIAGDQDLPHPA